MLTTMVNGEEGESAMLSCEMYGYLTDEIEWMRDGELLQPGADYAISSRSGDRMGQNGGETTTNSVISDLTVLQLEQQDAGTYVCRAKGTTVQRQVDLEISRFQHCTTFDTCVYALRRKILVIERYFHASSHKTNCSFVMAIFWDRCGQ